MTGVSTDQVTTETSMALDAQAGDEEGTLAAKHIAKAEAFREAGKVHFQAGNYRAALAEYHQIYLYVNGFSAKGASADKASGLPSSASQPSVTEDEMVRINELKFVHFSNVALCLMKLGNAAKSVTYSTKVRASAPPLVQHLSASRAERTPRRAASTCYVPTCWYSPPRRRSLSIRTTLSAFSGAASAGWTWATSTARGRTCVQSCGSTAETGKRRSSFGGSRSSQLRTTGMRRKNSAKCSRSPSHSRRRRRAQRQRLQRQRQRRPTEPADCSKFARRILLSVQLTNVESDGRGIGGQA